MPERPRSTSTEDAAARFIVPMRPQMVSELPDDPSKWIYEPKLDGYRAVAVKNGQEIRLYSMEGRSFNERFPDVITALKKVTANSVVLDGELVAIEPTGRPNFNELQNAARTKLPIRYIAFDVLHYEGSDLFNKVQEATFFLGGYIPGRSGVGELLIGEFRDDGTLHFIKRLTAGLNPFNRRQIYDAIQDLRSSRCPFVNLPENASKHQHPVTEEVMRKCIWLKPDQPAEIEFIERTPHGRLRHASFRRLLSRSGQK